MKERARQRHQHPGKRLPAFGKALLEMRRQGLAPTPPEVFVCLDCWDWWKTRARCVVAEDADPATLDFSFVAGIDVSAAFSLRFTTRARRDELLRALVRANPRLLLAMDMDWRGGDFLVKSIGVGLERQEYA